MERMLKRIAIRKDGTISMSEFRKFAEKYQGEIDRLEEENKRLKKYYDRDKEELMESCYSLAKENDELKEKLEQIKEAYIKFEKSQSKREKEFNKAYGDLDQLIMNR